MKGIIIGICLFFFVNKLFAQNQDTAFTKQWRVIDSLLKIAQLPESDINKNIANFQSEINKTNDKSVRAILHVLKAKQFQSYFNSHRWQLYNRSSIKKTTSSDILNWSSDDFFKAIEEEYQNALSEKLWLKKKKIDAFSAIIKKGNASYLRPTLFDAIAQDALEYFKISEYFKIHPVNNYTIQQQDAIGNYVEFATLKLRNTDSNSYVFKTIQLYQELTQFHLNDDHKEALIHIDIDRINWVSEVALIENKKQLKEKALKKIMSDFEVSESVYAWLQLIQDKIELAESYHPFQDSTERWQYNASLQLIDEATKKFANKNPVKNELENIKQTILSKVIRIHTDLIDLPNKPFRAMVEYKNVDTLYIRILSIPLEFTKSNLQGEKLIQQLCNKSAIQNKKQWLPLTNDHQQHFVEIKLDPLPSGEYVLLTSTSKDFSPTTDIINYQSIQVSGLSFLQNKTDFFVLDRETGKPVSNAHITMLSKPDHLRGNEWENEGTITTDENGYAKLSGQKNNRYYAFIIENKNEKFRTFDPTWFDSENTSKLSTDSIDFEKRNRKIYFFTDRPIYRPGQIVYFKAISSTIDFKNQKSKLLSKLNSTVYLRDLNNRIIDSINLTTNEFGSFNGKFVLPEKTLTGNFSITLKNGEMGSADFSVESYKRPTFNIQFIKIEKAYKLNDTIEIKGYAKAFAGNFISSSTLNYQIIRNVRSLNPFPRFLSYKNSSPQEIAQGSIQTDEKGAFTIQFKASADPTKDSSTKPVFDFSIITSITDASGETRTAIQQISCAYQSIIVEINHPEIINAEKETKIEVSATNLMTEKTNAIVNISISKLIGPDRILKERNWPRPDQFILSKEEYIRNFPYEIYNNENEISQFPIEKTILQTSINTRNNNEWKIEKGSLKAGYYVIEASAKDSLGNWELQKSYLQVFDPSSNSVASGIVNLFYTTSKSLEPGAKDTIYRGTLAKDLFVIRHFQNEKEQYHFVNPKQGVNSFIYDITENDRGGIYMEELFVFQNQIFINHYFKRVPFSNKELEINYKSFRDKSEPGGLEKWTVSITGKNGEKPNAELLTAMYDASLNEFKMHHWYLPDWWNEKYQVTNWKYHFGTGISEQNLSNPYTFKIDTAIVYDQFPDEFIGLEKILNGKMRGLAVMAMNPNSPSTSFKKTQDQNKEMHTSAIQLTQSNFQSPETIIRKNFNETAFFFPQLYADSTGKYSFSFTMPDAVTKWNWMSFAHTKDLSAGLQTAEIQTQKTLMLHSNAPRFMREGDKMEFSTNIANLSDKELTGQITLELIDATTNTSIDGWFQNIFPTQYFTVGAKQTEAVKFPIQIPYGFNKPLTWRVIAQSGNYSDGEENVLNVLSNRTLITETLPLLVKGDTTQQFHFEKLMHQNSSSLTNESLTIEFSSNPIWYAVQSLPYLKQGMDNCSESLFNKIYANSIAAYIVHKNPIIKTWFEESKKDSASLLSNLQKNQSLKQVLLEETPWVLAANSEAERKKNLSDLFDLLKLSASNQSSLEKLQEMQLPNGAFSWFKGGEADSYITTYILTGLGRLIKMGALDPDLLISIKPMLAKALLFSDQKINNEYQWMIHHTRNIKSQNLDTRQIHYLYMRSFYPDIEQHATIATNFYTQQCKEFWNQFSVYDQSLIGLIQLRNKEEKFVSKILLPSIFKRAVVDTQKGMYWKLSNSNWNSSSINTAAILVELASAYHQQNKSVAISKSIDAIKTRLILHKQTNNWLTSINTANACYALLVSGTEWLKQQKNVQIELGKTIVQSEEEKTEAGTGYFEKRIDGSKIDSTMGEVKVITHTINTTNSKNTHLAWGAIYWQYFEDLDKITEAKTPLNIQKELMVEKLTDQGKILVPVDFNNPLKVGDKIVIRLIIKTDRDMEYVHLKDMRAAGMEPMNIMSGFKWQDGMGYYENTTDISSHFFISRLNKGTYVFEYPVYLTHAGNFSMGIANIQCMYAPEFNGHTEGIRINVE